MSAEKEFGYNDKHFRFFQEQAKELAGVTLPDSKKEMTYSRLSRIIRKSNIKNFDDYCDLLREKNKNIVLEFVSSITTHHTFFMREAHHFFFLRDVILPEIISNNSARKVRTWSAGASSGEEAYCISFIMRDFFDSLKGWDFKILATDVDECILEKARKGIYHKKDLRQHFTEEQINRYFNFSEKEENDYEVKNSFKEIIHFKQFNFLDTVWPMAGPFDVIFCRNVVIYFDKKAQEYVFDRLASLLNPGGYLIIGHSESISSQNKKLKFLDKTIYRRIT